MSTYIDELDPEEVAQSLDFMRGTRDGRSLISYAEGDEHLALWLLMLGRCIASIGAFHTEFPLAKWRDYYERGLSPADAAYDVYKVEMLRFL